MMVLPRSCSARNVPLAKYSVWAAIWPVLARSKPILIGGAARATNGAASGAAAVPAAPSRAFRREINRPVLPGVINFFPRVVLSIGIFDYVIDPNASNLHEHRFVVALKPDVQLPGFRRNFSSNKATAP